MSSQKSRFWKSGQNKNLNVEIGSYIRISLPFLGLLYGTVPWMPYFVGPLSRPQKVIWRIDEALIDQRLVFVGNGRFQISCWNNGNGLWDCQNVNIFERQAVKQRIFVVWGSFG